MLTQVVFIIALLVGATIPFVVLRRIWPLRDTLVNAVLIVVVCVISAFACGAGALYLLRLLRWMIAS
jgi:hypothetical protein